MTCRAARILGLTALVALRTQANAQQMLIRSWFDESVKLLDVSPGSFNAFADDFVPSGSGGLGTPDALAWGADRNLSVSSNDSSQVLRYHGRSGAFVGVCDIDSDGNCDADDFFDYLDLFAGGCG